MQKPCIVLRIYILFLEFKRALLGMRLNGFIKNSVCSSVTGLVLLPSRPALGGGGWQGLHLSVLGVPWVPFGAQHPKSVTGPKWGRCCVLGPEATSCPFSSTAATSTAPVPRISTRPVEPLEPRARLPLGATREAGVAGACWRRGPGSPQHPSGLRTAQHRKQECLHSPSPKGKHGF